VNFILGYVRPESRSEIEEVEATIAIVIKLQERFPRPLRVQPRRLLLQHGHKHVARQELSFGPTCKHHPQNDDNIYITKMSVSSPLPSSANDAYLYALFHETFNFHQMLLLLLLLLKQRSNPNPHENKAEQVSNH
jgi:hypothetical protein